MNVIHPITQAVFQQLVKQYTNFPQTLQTLQQFLMSLDPYMDHYPQVSETQLLSLLLPERVIEFKVKHIDDDGDLQIHRGFRVQHSSLLGPYKGGLRFHPSVDEDTLRSLAFNQTLKNALSTMDLGGAKGGSDFNPKGKSQAEIARFSQAFIRALARDLGPTYDVPAGDLGVSQAEIGVMVQALEQIDPTLRFALTGKPISMGGSILRPEATGYGLVYFMISLLNHFYQTDFRDKRVIISGAGNVALGAAQKVVELGGRVVGMSDSQGFLSHEAGLDIKRIKAFKLEQKGALADYDGAGTYQQGHGLYELPCDVALACATQNEVTLVDVQLLRQNQVLALGEGANMALTKAARDYVRDEGMLLGVDIAANAGGVIVSGFEMIQNAKQVRWSAAQVDAQLQMKMQDIFKQVMDACERVQQPRNLVVGASLAGFNRLIKAWQSQHDAGK